MDPPVIEIALRVCHTEGNSITNEMIEAVAVCPHRYRLLYSPGVVEGVAKGDVIEFNDTDPKGFTVVSRSGLLCVWFFFEEQGRNRGPDGDAVRAAVEDLGGECDGGGNTNLVFSIPFAVGFAAIESLMDELVARYPGATWMYGNVYDPWNDFKPLDWWDTPHA